METVAAARKMYRALRAATISERDTTMTTATKPANTNRDPYAVAYGAKYKKDLDVTDVAKLVRADIKALVKSGELPKAKYSVRCDRYSMGRSLDVVVLNVPFPLLNEARVLHDLREPNRYMRNDELPRNSEAARALLAKVEEVVGAYNFDGSDMQSDYYHVNFASDVKLSWEQEQTEREGLEARFASALAADEKPGPVLTPSTCKPLAPFPKATDDVVDHGCVKCGPVCLLPDPVGDDVSVQEAWS
jgi:hypothetical protein